MCNLYSQTTGQEAMRRLFNATLDATGNLAPQPGIFPDYPAPIVRNTEAGRELAMVRWGMPSPKFVLKPSKANPSITIDSQTRVRWSTLSRPS